MRLREVVKALDLQENKKKMAKIMIEEFDVCHKSVDEEIQYLLPNERRKFVEISHVVGCNEFIIFVSYDKKIFGSDIEQFISDIIQKAKQSDLHQYHWKVHRPIVEKTKNWPCDRFIDRFNISFTAV